VLAVFPNPPLFPKALLVPDPNDPPPKPPVVGFAPNKPEDPVVFPPPNALVVLVLEPNPPDDPNADGVLVFCCGCPKADVVFELNKPPLELEVKAIPVFGR
jgi:hypothetical protein